MPTEPKPKPTSSPFSPEQIAAAIDWSKGVVTRGGGVAATIGAIKRTRGPNKQPTKAQVAIRLDPDVLSAFLAGGPGWQTRLNAALKDWLASQPKKRPPRRKTAA